MKAGNEMAFSRKRWPIHPTAHKFCLHLKLEKSCRPFFLIKNVINPRDQRGNQIRWPLKSNAFQNSIRPTRKSPLVFCSKRPQKAFAENHNFLTEEYVHIIIENTSLF